MFNDFSDIRSRVGEEPTWYDENGTPRYGEFHPTLISSIYATEVSLIDVMCSICFKRFCCARYIDDVILANLVTNVTSQRNIIIKKASLGAWDKTCDFDLAKFKHMCKWDDDPPNHVLDGCHIGSCSLSITLGVIQYWIKRIENQNYPRWHRDALKEDAESTRQIRNLAYSKHNRRSND